MAIEKKTDHIESGLEKVLSQDVKKPIITALFSIPLRRVQELEDALWEILELRSLDDAEGVQLDAIGRLVGRGRNGLNDAHYRLALLVQIRINRSRGLTLDVTEVMRLSVPEGTLLEYRDWATATILASIGPGDYDYETTRENLRRTRGGGIRLIFETFSDPDAFTFDSESGGVPATDGDVTGWGDPDDSNAGGLWSDFRDT